MLNVNDLYEINLQLLPAQIDLLLESLQLYAFNFHNVWAVNIDSREEDLRNTLIFHTYEQILAKYNNEKVKYDVLKACKLKHKRQREKNYKKLKNIA